VGHIVLWALLTGGITGGAWVGIVLLRRQRRLTEEQWRLLEATRAQLDVMAETQARLSEAEARLDDAERALLQRPRPD
jgi:hypothetical protein